jgi:peptidyl-prolyl cis-trans isomerase SurA
VILTKQGFTILKVTDHQTAGVPSFKEVEPQVENALYLEKLQPALREYLARLREEAYIHITAGYVDSAATPNETEPVKTDTEEAKAKKLTKKKKKLGIL